MSDTILLALFPVVATFGTVCIACIVTACISVFHVVKARQELRKKRVYNVNGVVVRKYVCFPRTGDKNPVIQVPSSIQEELRESGRCEFMVQISCTDGYTFAEWINADMFDAVTEGSPMLVTYSTQGCGDERTRVLIRTLP